MRRTKGALLQLGILILAASLPLAARNTLQNRQALLLKDALKHRGDVQAVVDIYQAFGLREDVPDKALLRSTLEKIAQSPGSNAEVAAHAENLLAFLDRQAGLWNKAAGRYRKLGLVRTWEVIGPFSDENKSGYDTKYPPEKDLDLKGAWEGKTEKVSWRVYPQYPSDPVIRLGAVLDPSDKAAGYALAFVQAKRRTSCVIRGAYDEAYKLWVNGEQVGGAKDYNGASFDQYADACTLSAGWNVLLVKVCNQEGNWDFSLRLTDARGRALRNIKTAAIPEDVTEHLSHILKKDGRAPQGFRFFDPGRVLEKRAAVGGSGKAEELLGLYRYYERNFDKGAALDSAALRKAAAKLPKDPQVWIELGDAEADHNHRRAAYAKALDLAPGSAQALERMGQYYLRRRMTLKAMEYLNKSVQASPGCLAYLCLRDRVRLSYLTDGIAAHELTTLHSQYPHAGCVTKAYITAMGHLGDIHAKLKAATDFMQSHQADESAYPDVLAGLKTLGKTSEVLHLYDKLRERFPLDREVVGQEAQFLVMNNRPEEARKILADFLQKAPGWAGGQALLGETYLALNRRSEALKQYERALLLKPQKEEWKRKLRFLKPQETPFYSSYRIEPREIPSVQGRFSDQQKVVLADNTVIEVQKNGLSKRYVQRVVQVLQEGAVDSAQYFPISFDPDRQEVRVLEAVEIKPDGTRIHADTYLTDLLSDPQFRLYYRNRNLVLHFPGVTPGDKIWIEYLVSDLPDSNDYGNYFGDLERFAASVPILYKEYTLLLPASFNLYYHQAKIPGKPMTVIKGTTRIYRWVVHNEPSLQQEPNMPGYTQVGPYLHVSTFKDWGEMGKWYAGFIQDQWAMTPAVKEKVAELIKGKKSLEAKVEAVHDWVVQNTRYVGLEFGVHGYKPYKVRQIFERRFGDCKDKALLLAAMLRQAGVPAAITLVRTRDLGSIAPEPASLAVFDHAICYVPELNLYLDGTAEYSGIHELPYQDQGVWVLDVWPDGRTERVKTPVDTWRKNVYRADYTLTVSKGATDAQVTAHLSFTGQECAWMRQRFQDRDKQREVLQSGLSNSYPGTRIDKADSSDLENLNIPVEISFTGDLGHLVREEGPDHATLPVCMGQTGLSSRFAGMKQRTYPVEIPYPWRQVYHVRYQLPPGTHVDSLPSVDTTSPFGSVSRTMSVDKGVLTVETEITLSVRSVPPDAYSRFREFCIKADQAAAARIRIRYSGGRP